MAITLFIVSVIPVGAITLYNANGYIYTLDTDDGLAALYSVEPEISDVNVPRSLDGNLIGSIYDYAFYKNKDIVSLNLNNAVFLRSIGEMAFANTNIKDVTIPYWVGNVTFADFQDCSLLESIIVNANIQTIPAQFCNRCNSLSSVKIPDSVTLIEKYAFANCPSLTYMELSSNVRSIASSAFNNCPNLILGVYKDSYALQYAEENQIDHIILDGPKIGDVNGDAVVDILDATDIQKYVAESTDFTDEQFDLGDINKDGYCDVIDALLVQKSVIGAYELPQNIIRY